MNKHKYRILMFSPAFAPLANPEAIVNSKLVLAMLAAGWDVNVISRRLTGQTDYDYGSEWVEPWLKLKKVTHIVEYNCGGRTRKLVESLWGGLQMGHIIDGCRWAKYAYDHAMLLHEKCPYHVILSRFAPNAAHLPAMKMSIKTGLPWIANWNDPWDFLRTRSIRGGLANNISFMNYRCTQSVARKASWHTFPGDKLREVMCSYLDIETDAKSATIPHIALPLTIESIAKKDSIFKIGYIGRLWKQQDPTCFFEGLKTFIKRKGIAHRVLFRFVGIDDIGIKEMVRKADIPIELDILGRCAYLDSLMHASSCDILLVIDPQEANGIIMTSKFSDYVQTGKPILAITTPDSTISSIVGNEEGGIAVDCCSSESIVDALCELYEHWESGNLDNKYGSQGLYCFFSPETIISQYENIFAQIGVKTIEV